MNPERLSILSNASKADVRTEPYPHLVIRNALDAEVFAQLAEEYPDWPVVLNGREKQDTWYDYPACLAVNNDQISPLWKRFMEYHTSGAFFSDVLGVFEEQLLSCHPDLVGRLGKPLDQLSTGMRQPGAADNRENYVDDVSLECQFYVNFTEQPRIIRGPHVDRPTELYAALLYFRSEDDDSTGSNLDVCAAKDPDALYPDSASIKADHLPMEVDADKVDVVNSVTYEANTLVFFLNSAKSLHAVSPRSPTNIPRRHINFTADLFNLGEDALFDVRLDAPRRMKKWLEKQPVIWRAAGFLPD